MFASDFQFVKLWEETLSLVMNRVKYTAPWTCMTVSCGNDSDGTEKRLPFEPEGAEKPGGRQTKRKKKVLYTNIMVLPLVTAKPKTRRKIKKLNQSRVTFQV